MSSEEGLPKAGFTLVDPVDVATRVAQADQRLRRVVDTHPDKEAA